MGALPLIVELAAVFGVTGLLLHRYGDWRRQHLFCTVSTFVGWYFCFIIVFVLPLDVALTFYHQCVHDHPTMVVNHSVPTTTLSPTSTPTTLPAVDQQFDQWTGNVERRRHVRGADDAAKSLALHAVNVSITAITDCRIPSSYVSKQTLLSLWRVVYWTSQILTWLVLPLMQSYSNAGDFTATGKLKTAIYNNALYYGSYMLIFGFLLLYVVAKGYRINAEQLKVVCITASNTWGLFLLVLLLGYGLVELPRQLWQMGNKGYRLQKTYFDVEKLSGDKNDAEEALKESYQDTVDAVKSMRQNHPLAAHAHIVLNRFPPEVVAELNRARGSGSLSSTIGDSDASSSHHQRSSSSTLRDSDAANLAGDEKSLVRLHKRVIDALQCHHRTQAQWTALINQALHLEDVARNEVSSPNQHFMRTHSGADRSLLHATVCTPSIEWWWECRLKRPLLRVAGVLCAAMSMVIVWSECTFFLVRPMLSLAALSVAFAAQSNNYAYIELSSIVIIAYLCVCAYYTVFKLRIYRYYHLDPHHQTDENSLLFSAMLLCRLTPPLCLNFLGMIHLDSHVTSDAKNAEETSFTHLMGHMDVIAVVASGFNVYFPIAIVVLCAASYLRIGTRCLHSIGIDQFVAANSDGTADMVNAGKALVSLERNRRQREMNREARQDYWQGKLPGGAKAAATDARARYNQQRRGFGQEEDCERGDTADEYTDRDPILPLMERRIDSAPYREPRSSGERPEAPPPQRYGSEHRQPPRGIFDDL